MRKALLLLASLALVFVHVRAEVVLAEEASNFRLPWDIPSNTWLKLWQESAAPSTTLTMNTAVEEVQVFIVQAMVSSAQA